MPTLDQIGLHFNTDKSSRLHDYLKVYEFALKDIRHESFTLMELGVGPTNNMGKSLLTWAEFFPNAKIVGIDIRDDARAVASDRISVEIGDCGDIHFLHSIAKKYQPKVILDDASHKWSHQILSFEILFPALVGGGLFICEDLGTSYAPWTSRASHPDHYEDAASYYMRLSTTLLGNAQNHSSFTHHAPSAIQVAAVKLIDYILISRETVIIKKKP